MENIVIPIKQGLYNFFSDIREGYFFSYDELQIDNNNKFNYTLEIYKQYWQNKTNSLEVEFSVIEKKERQGERVIYMIFFVINKYSSSELLSSLDLYDYFDKKIKKKIPFLNDFEGNNLEEKLDSFFKWFLENIDYRLIKIFRGEDWVEIPFDWGIYK